MRHPRPLLAAALAATGVVAAAAPSADAAPISVLSVTPKTVPVQGLATAIFKITGGAVDATSSIVVRGTEFDASPLSNEVESLTIVSAGLSGAGHLSIALPPLTGFPPSCERGGIHPSSSINAYTLTIPAHAVTALVVKVKVPQGFASQTPGVEVTSGPLIPVDGPRPATTAKADVATAPVPRTGVSLDGAELTIGASDSQPGAYVAKGRIYPARGGAMVRIIGIRTNDAPSKPAANLVAEQTLGVFNDAMAPIDDRLSAFAKTRTNAAGRYAVRFNAPKGTVVVARTRGTAGVTAAGASCPVQLGY